MFYVSKIEGKDKFYVTDTADNVTECLSRTDLIRAADMGICIEGVMVTKRNGKKDVSRVVSDDRFNEVISKMGQPVNWDWGKDEFEHIFALYVGRIFDEVTNENYLCLYNMPTAFNFIDASLFRRTSIDGIIAVSVNKILFTKGMFIEPSYPTDPSGKWAYCVNSITRDFEELRKTHDLNSIRLL